jgi:hypothetical protein
MIKQANIIQLSRIVQGLLSVLYLFLIVFSKKTLGTSRQMHMLLAPPVHFFPGNWQLSQPSPSFACS